MLEDVSLLGSRENNHKVVVAGSALLIVWTSLRKSTFYLVSLKVPYLLGVFPSKTFVWANYKYYSRTP